MCEKFWITYIAVIAVISSRSSSAQAQFQNTSELQKNETIQIIRPARYTENITKLFGNVFTVHSPQILFEVILADSMKNFLPLSDVNEKCAGDGLQYMAGLNNQTPWAVQMYESSAKYPSSEVELGNFDQCMSAASEPLGIRAAYAVVQMRFRRVRGKSTTVTTTTAGTNESLHVNSTKMPMPVVSMDLQWALCLPDSCTEADVETSVRRALASVLEKTSHRVSIEVSVPRSMYTSARTLMPVTGAVLFACGIFVSGLTLVMAATVYDWCRGRGKDTIFSSAVCTFSASRNLKNLMADLADREFAIVNGFKTLALISVQMGHRIGMDFSLPSFNPEYPKSIFEGFWLSFMKSPVSVEVFFIISGFFTYIVIERRLRNGKPLKFIYLLCYRLFRIVPMYITAIMIFAFFLPYMNDGPLWKQIIYPEAEFCRKNWWTNLLFINNYVNSNEMCMVISWYLACDMHFFIVGIILTYVVWRWKTVGIGIFGILFAASVYLPAKYIYDNEQWGVFPFTYSNVKNIRAVEHFQNVYIKSHHRITTYLIGMATAYIYLEMKNSKITMSITSRTIGFIVSMLFHSACYICIGFLYLPDQTYNPWHHLFFFTFQRIVHALTISYLLIVGSLSNFGFISNILECKLFVVIARISYVMYLTHYIGQLQSIGQIRQPFSGNYWLLYWRINADLSTALFYSLLINLIVEAPFRKISQHLMDIILNDESEKSVSENHQETNGHSKNTAVLPRFNESH